MEEDKILHGILLKKAKEDITSKSIFEKVVDKSFEKKGIHSIRENVKMFYGDSFDKANEDELKQFFVNMLNAITSIRHRVVHYNMNTNSENIFNFSDIEVSRLLKSIFEKETDKRNPCIYFPSLVARLWTLDTSSSGRYFKQPNPFYQYQRSIRK